MSTLRTSASPSCDKHKVQPTGSPAQQWAGVFVMAKYQEQIARGILTHPGRKHGNYLMHYQDGVIYSYRTPIAVISGSNIFLNTHSSSGYTSRHIWSVSGCMSGILGNRYNIKNFFMFYNDPTDEYCPANCLEGSSAYNGILTGGFDRNDVVQMLAAQLVLRLPECPVSRFGCCSDYNEIVKAEYTAMPCRRLEKTTKDIEHIFEALGTACKMKMSTAMSRLELNRLVNRTVYVPLLQIVSNREFKYKPWNQK